MLPSLLFSTLFVSYTISLVKALPQAAITIPSRSSITPTTTTIAAAVTNVASTTYSAAISTSTDISPLGSSTDVFTQGQACKASWIPASSSSTKWKNTTITLMTGSNFQMMELATVAQGLDGTLSSLTSYEFMCPFVSPNAPIYFLQYTHDNGLDPMWTTRFTVANSQGIWDPAPESTQPGGVGIAWGNGVLVVTTTSAPSDSDSTQGKTSSSLSDSDGSNSSTYSSSSTTSSSLSTSGSLSSFQRPVYTLLALAVAAFL